MVDTQVASCKKGLFFPKWNRKDYLELVIVCRHVWQHTIPTFNG